MRSIQFYDVLILLLHVHGYSELQTVRLVVVKYVILVASEYTIRLALNYSEYCCKTKAISTQSRNRPDVIGACKLKGLILKLLTRPCVRRSMSGLGHS